MSTPVVEKLNQAISTTMSSKFYATKMRAIGGVVIPKPLSTSEATTFAVQEEARWRGLDKEINISLE